VLPFSHETPRPHTNNSDSASDAHTALTFYLYKTNTFDA
ncbi:MAG: hypothetical protein ACI9E5_000694, partial [Candidatus Omnitrophota bacterium]